MRVEVSARVAAPPATVFEVYANYADWPQLFRLIRDVRLVRRDGDRLVLQIDHAEGSVVNEVTLDPPGRLDLWERKRRYDATFHNRFEPVPGGTRFTDVGEIELKGWARLLRPFLRPVVRRRMRQLQVEPVKAEAERRAERDIGRR